MNNKFTRNVDDKLEDALTMLAAGVPVSEILTDAGEDADWLRPLLEIATEVGELQTARVPSPQASLQRMLAYSEELAAASAPVRPVQPGRLTVLASLVRGGWLPRLATGLVSVLLMVVLLGGTLTVLAERSLPGQPLYGLKRTGEMLRLGLTLDSAQRDQLLKNYNQRRQMEAKLLLKQNQVATIDFLGQVEGMVTGTSLTLDSLAIQLTPQTKVSGNLAVGARVEVKVMTQPPDQLIALAVIVIEPAPPPPTPLPSPTPTLTPRPSPTATATTTRSLSSATDTLKLPTATPTDVLTNTPTVPPPSPTATSLPPTATQPAPIAIPPAGGNDNTNENGNEDIGNNDNANGNDNDNSGGDNSGSGGGGSGSSGGDSSGSGGGGSGSSGGDHSGSGGGGD